MQNIPAINKHQPPLPLRPRQRQDQPESPDTTRPLRIISLGSLLELDLPEREFLIAPWLRQSESAMIYAPPGVGKSMFALSLSLAIAGGGTLLGWNAPKARRVLYIDGEMPIDDIRDRAAMLLPSVGGDDCAASKNMVFMARQHQDMDTDFPDLATEQGRESILHQARAQGVELVVLDNLSTLATVEDENAASAFNAPIAFLLKMKQAGLACILIHHSGKGGGSYRGSSKIATTFEVILGLEAQKDPLLSRDTDTTTFRLCWNKLRGKRDKNTGISLDVTLTSIPQPDGSLSTQWTAETSVDQQLETMIALLRSGECATQRDVAKAMGLSPGHISKLKTKAILKELITDKEWINLLKNAASAQVIRDEEEETGSGAEESADF